MTGQIQDPWAKTFIDEAPKTQLNPRWSMRNQTVIFSAKALRLESDQENGQPNGGAKEVAEKPKGRKRRVPLVAHAHVRFHMV